MLGGKLHGIAVKVVGRISGGDLPTGNLFEASQLLGGDRGNFHSLVFDSCGSILSLEKCRVGDNQLLELFSPLVQSSLELVVLGPVLVGDSVSPGPPHTNLLQSEVSSLVQNLEVNVGDCDNSFLELLVILLTPLSNSLSLLLNGLARSSYSRNDLLVDIVSLGSSKGRDLASQTLKFLINCGFKVIKELLALGVDLFLDHTLGNFAYALFQISGTLVGLCSKLGLPGLQVLSHHLAGLSASLALILASRRSLHRVDVFLRTRFNYRLGALCGNRGLRGRCRRLSGLDGCD